MKGFALIPHKDTLHSLCTEQMRIIKEFNQSHEKELWLLPLYPLWALTEKNLFSLNITKVSILPPQENEESIYFPFVCGCENEEDFVLKVPFAKKNKEKEYKVLQKEISLTLIPKSIKAACISQEKNCWTALEEKWLKFSK